MPRLVKRYSGNTRLSNERGDQEFWRKQESSNLRELYTKASTKHTFIVMIRMTIEKKGC